MPPGEDREKKSDLGEGRFGTKPDLKEKDLKDNNVSSVLVVLLRSTNMGIKLGVTHGQESAPFTEGKDESKRSMKLQEISTQSRISVNCLYNPVDAFRVTHPETR